jgi:hypothetical protein
MRRLRNCFRIWSGRWESNKYKLPKQRRYHPLHDSIGVKLESDARITLWRPHEKKQFVQNSAIMSFSSLRDGYLKSLAIKGFSANTLRVRGIYIGMFIRWCETNGIVGANEMHNETLVQFQEHLFFHRKMNGQPLASCKPTLPISTDSIVVPVDASPRSYSQRSHGNIGTPPNCIQTPNDFDQTANGKSPGATRYRDICRHS